MSENGVDAGKRRLLIAATAGVGAVGTGFLAVPFLSSWMPSERAKSAGAPVEVDISKLESGARVVVQWRGKPVWVVKRTPEMLERVKAMAAADLKDAQSADEAMQPVYAQNEVRSLKPDILVLVGICTHLGCSPLYQPEVTATMPSGGFFCPCHGSKFDLAGRVYAGAPAGANLEVPPYRFVTDTLIMVGEDTEVAA